MNNATVFKSSFNRSNLFTKLRAKRNVIKEIVKFVKQNNGKSGIIYCLSRKKVEEVAEALSLNVSSIAIHAGLESKIRADTQINSDGGCRCIVAPSPSVWASINPMYVM